MSLLLSEIAFNNSYSKCCVLRNQKHLIIKNLYGVMLMKFMKLYTD